MTHESLHDLLAPVLRVLRDLNGEFVFSDDEGNRYVLARKEDAAYVAQEGSEQQLPLLSSHAVEAVVRQHAPDLADDVIAAINRDIALSHEDHEVEITEDDLALPFEEDMQKVTFEPLKGDLAPELQD